MSNRCDAYMTNKGLLGWWLYTVPRKKSAQRYGLLGYLHPSLVTERPQFLVNVTSDCAGLLPTGDVYFDGKMSVQDAVVLEEDWPRMKKLKLHEVAAYFL